MKTKKFLNESVFFESDFQEQSVKNMPTDEIATLKKDVDIFAGFINPLPNPDPVIRTESGGRGLKLYDEIDRDPHAGSVLQTRYLSVIARSWTIEPATDSDADKKIADFITEVLKNFNFDQARAEVMASRLYGHYEAEIIWQRSRLLNQDALTIEVMRSKHPRRFVFTNERELRLLTPQSLVFGEPVPERKFIVSSWGDSDNPYGKGLGQRLWWPIWFKKNGIKFWVSWLDKLGIPTAIGKYPPGTDKDKQGDLLEILGAIQNESGVVFPENLMIEFLESSRTMGKGNLFEVLTNFMNAEMSKTVLGQTMTTEIGSTGGAFAAGKVHNEVRHDILQADAQFEMELYNNSLVPWITIFNFPNVQLFPKFSIRTELEKDLKQLADRDKTLVDLGLPITKKYFYNTYDIPQPAEGDEIIITPTQQDPPRFSEWLERYPTRFGQDTKYPVGTGHRPAGKKKSLDLITPQQIIDFADELDVPIGRGAQEIIDQTASGFITDAGPIFDAIIKPINAVIQTGTSYEQISQAIDRIAPDINIEPLAKSLTKAQQQAASIGIEAINAEVSADTGATDRDVPGAELSTNPAISASDFQGETVFGPGLPFKEALEALKRKSLTIAGVTKTDLINDVKNELIRAINKGTTLDDFKKAAPDMFIRRGYAVPDPWHVETIYRTNMQTAYQAGRFNQMTSEAVIKARPFWQYIAVQDDATRPEHSAMSGRVFPADHPIWQSWYPPNGFNCRCYVRTMSARQVKSQAKVIQIKDPTGRQLPGGRVLQPDKGFDKLPLAA